MRNHSDSHNIEGAELPTICENQPKSTLFYTCAQTFDGQIDLALLDIKLPDIAGKNLYPLIMKAG